MLGRRNDGICYQLVYMVDKSEKERNAMCFEEFFIFGVKK